MSIAVIGHVTKDIVEIDGDKKEKIGGTAFYSSITLANLGIKTQIFTKLAAEDKSLLDSLKHKNISLTPIFCNSTTCFRNVYNSGKRAQFVDSVAETFSVNDIKKLKNCNIVHLGPLTKDEISYPVIEYLKSLGLIISLDVQGYLRKIKNRKVRLARWKEKKEFLKHVDIVKADGAEARVLTGKTGKAAAKAIAAMGPIEVIVTDGANGSMIYSRKQAFKIPAIKPVVITDVTGAGDTYIAAYLARRLSSGNVRECGLFAARCATAKIENGVFGFKS